MNTINKITESTHVVFKTSIYTSAIPRIIVVDSLAHSLHNQVTYHVQSMTHTAKHIGVGKCLKGGGIGGSSY